MCCIVSGAAPASAPRSSKAAAAIPLFGVFALYAGYLLIVRQVLLRRKNAPFLYDIPICAGPVHTLAVRAVPNAVPDDRSFAVTDGGRSSSRTSVILATARLSLRNKGARKYKKRSIIMAEDSVNYAEYTVTKKAEGSNRKKRILLIAAYLIYAVIAIVAMLVFKLAMWGFLFFLLFIILVFFTWKLVKEERKYECLNAKLVISELNEGIGAKPKVVSEDLISAYSIIAPTTDEYKDKWSVADEIKDFRGDSKSPDSYFARLEKDGKSTVVLFEVTNKMLKVMKFYNSKGTVVTEVRR